MSQEFEGDLRGAEFWGADLRDATFRDVDLTGARISHAFVHDVEIDATVDALVVNGVDVTDYVNERDPWHPLRSMLRPADADAAGAAWAALEDAWEDTIARAGQLPDEALEASVDGEWSFVETLRHLVFAIDKWFIAPILGGDFDPMGLPNSGSVDFPWPNVTADARPTLAEVLAVRAERAERFREYLTGVSTSELGRTVDVLENGTCTVIDCIHTVLEEEFWHNRYARRDLAALGAAGAGGAGDTGS